MQIQNYTLASLLILSVAGCDSDGEGTTQADPTETSGASETEDGTPSDSLGTTGDSTSTGTSTGSSTSGDPSTSSSSSTSGEATTDVTEGSSSEGSESGEETGTGGATQMVEVEWTNEDIVEGCFLFVDPTVLGTAAVWDEQLDDTASLVFDALDAIEFSGPSTRPELVLGSEDSDVFAGDTWVFTQTFDGTVTDGHFTGTWSYSECNQTQAPDSCPADGGCSGTADFDITLPQ
ncbi:MAG: hypothetical protein ACRBN8_43110 [Nannocystales bacterium]